MVNITRITPTTLIVMIFFLTIIASALVSSGTSYFQQEGTDIRNEQFNNQNDGLGSSDDGYSDQEMVELKLYNHERTSRMNEAIKLESKQEGVARPELPSTNYNLLDTEVFWVADDYLVDYEATTLYDMYDQAMYEVTAEVVRITDHAYIFKATNPDPVVSVSESELDALAAVFESTIFPVETDLFTDDGQPPDVDGNERIIILILDIRDAKYHGSSSYYIAGYFWQLHAHPTTSDGSITDFSEYKEIIHIDIQSFADNIDQDTVAHEFQHLLHYDYDTEETAWLDEGCAVLAEYLCGYTDGWYDYIYTSSGFMNQPGTSLTYWQSVPATYGAVFSFMLMIQQTFGNDTIVDIVADSTRQGMASVEAQTGVTSKDLFATFTYWNVINDKSKGYGYDAFSARAKIISLSSLPVAITNQYVPYWATKYYGLPDGDMGTLNITVTGTTSNNITADLLVLNQSGMYEAFSVKNKEENTGELILNNFGTEYSDAILVVYSLSGTDSGYYAEAAPNEYFNLEINIIHLAIYHGPVNYEKTTYSETITFRNITVTDTLIGSPWGVWDVTNSSAAIFKRDTNEEVINVTGVVQWNNTCNCWQAYFDDVSNLEPGFYYVKVTLVTDNATAVIKSDSFEIVRPFIIDKGSGEFKDGVISYSGIKIGYSNGTIWPSTTEAEFQLFYENGTLIYEALLVWNSASQSWRLPVISAGFEQGDRVYLVFTFEYAGEYLSFQSDILENGVSSTPVITGFISYISLVAIAFISLYTILYRKQKRGK